MNVKRVAENYRALCVSNDSNSGKFWHVVVLTASDEKSLYFFLTRSMESQGKSSARFCSVRLLDRYNFKKYG